MARRRDVLFGLLAAPFCWIRAWARQTSRGTGGQFVPATWGVEVEGTVTVSTLDKWVYITMPPFDGETWLSGAFAAQFNVAPANAAFNGQARLSYRTFGEAPLVPSLSIGKFDPPYVVAIEVKPVSGGGWFFKTDKYTPDIAADVLLLEPIGIARYWWTAKSVGPPSSHDEFVIQHSQDLMRPKKGAPHASVRPRRSIARAVLGWLEEDCGWNCVGKNCCGGGPGADNCGYTCLNDGQCTVHCSGGKYACCGCEPPARCICCDQLPEG